MTDEFKKNLSSEEACRKDDCKQIIGGWFSVFKYEDEKVRDLDKETINMQSYSNAYLDFSKNYRAANFDHEGGIRGELIDNILIDSPEFAKMLVHEITGLPLDDIPVQKLGHFGSFQFEDADDYELAKKSKLMFSIEGTCERSEIE